MIVLQDPKRCPVNRGLVVALGNFDGLHRGHRKLLTTANHMAGSIGAASGVVTFFPHTGDLLRKENQVLYTEQQKQKLIEETGQIDYLIRLTFDRMRMEQPPDVFFEEVLLKRLDVRGVVIGENFHFGYKGAGTAQTMELFCKQAGVLCRVVPAVYEDGEIICSTRIRRLIREGNMEEAEKLLVKPYMIIGRVAEGKQLGRKLQVPTANLHLSEDRIMPRRGVYVSRTRIGEKNYFSVTNVGNNPTLGGEILRAETHILDMTADLYGKEVRVELLHFLRPEICFENTEALKEQLRQDIEATRKYFE